MTSEKDQSKNTIYVRCNLCGADDTSPWLEGSAGKVVICNKCGLIYVNPRPPIEWVQEIYDEDYSSYFIKRAPKKLRRARRILKGIHKLTRPPGRLLDIGCSAGFFIQASKEAGWDVDGVEPSLSATTYAFQTYGLKIFNGLLEQAAFPARSFDVITSFNAIEHDEDPLNHLREICRILKDDGLVLIWTPDASHPWARCHRKKYFMVDRIEHLYYFHRKVLYRMLDAAGLRFAGLAGMNLKPGMKIYARKKVI